MPVCVSEPAPLIKDADELITKKKEIVIKFDYPLSTPAEMKFKSTKGFTRKKIFECIHKGYKKIYASEKDPGHIPGMYNRKTSEGKYGIWGHDIGDLVVEEVQQTKPGYFTLSIGS